MGRRWRKRKDKREQELMVVETEYRAPRRCSYGLWKKKIKALRKAEEEIIRQKKEALDKAMAEHWRKVWETDGFDLGPLKGYWRMLGFKGEDCPLVVKLYAMLGLHRHNMLEGTNLQLHRIEKYNRLGMAMPASYYITLLAEDPATSSLVPFQTLVDEGGCNIMSVTCYIARLKNTGTKCTIDWDTTPQFCDCRQVPEWPLQNAFADKNRFFYEVQKSEWEENDWIRLYLELAFATTNRRIHNWRLFEPNLSNLKILNVVVETEEPPNARVLKCFRNAVVYITYDQDLGEDGVCKRRAIVRRTVDLISKCFCLVGKTLQVPEEAFNNN